VLACVCLLTASGCKKGDDEAIPVDDTPVQHSEISNKAPKGCGGGFWSHHYGQAYKTLREAEEYKAGQRDYYVSELNDHRNEYLLAGISPEFRKDWFSSHKTAEKDQQCMMGIFDELSAAAKRTLPKYRPRGYTHHDSDEEDLMAAAVKEEFPEAEVIQAGVKQKNWEIEKLRNGNPSSRYKYGMAWIKSPKFDDGYCRIFYVNIVQDHAGGGTYADSKANYISNEPAGCK
jgi:hypothetical protein